MGTTQLADLSAGWIPASQMTLVFDGTMTYPGGQNTITFPLSTIFPYTGGNLVVMWNRPMDTVYFSSSDFFKCQTVGTNRARNIFSDSVTYDPENVTAGTLTGQFPKTTFVMTPMGGDPAFMITPASKDFGTVILNSTHNQNFSVMNIGGGALTITGVTITGSPVFSLQNVPTLPVSLNTGQTMVFTGRFSPTSPGLYTATITVTDNLARSYEIKVNPNADRASRESNNRMPHTVALSGNCIDTTINVLPYLQTFDAVTAPALPPDWLKLVQSAAAALVQTYTTTPNSTPNCAGMTNGTDANATAILIAPPLGTTIATNTTRVKFWAKSGAAGYLLSVGVMSDATNAATYTETQVITLTTTWTEYMVTFAGYTGTGKHAAFKHGLGGTSRLLYLDDVMLEVTPTNDLAATLINGNTTPTVGAPSIYNVTVFNWGTAAQSTYSVKLMSGTTELATAAGVTINPGASVQVPISWVPTATGPITIYGKVVLTGDQNPLNDQSNNLIVTALPSGTFSLTVGDGSQNARMPVDMFYKNSVYETIIYPNELSGFIGQITGISLYNNFTTTTLTNKPTKIWIGTTTLADLSAGWIPSTQLTLVFDGTVNYPGGQNTIAINFAEPFLYLNGENLVLMFYRPMDTAYFSSSDYFKCQTVGTNRARNIYSDSVTYDPATVTAGTLTGQFPKITFTVIPGGVGHVNGTVLGVGNQPLQDVAVQIPNTTYSTVTNAAGQYQLINVLPNNYSISFSKYGYVTQTQNFTLEEDETEVINVTMNPMATVSLGGTILASDTAAGLANAVIQFSGYQNYTATTAANGTFSIPAVYASQTYSYTVTCPGFRIATGTVQLGAVNHTMPPMTLNELAFAPWGVVAALNQAQNEVTLTWNAPNPLAVDVLESFEATTFPPNNWTRVINNTGPANELGVLPTWCSFGSTQYYGYPAVPTNGTKQAGIGFSTTYSHQDEWLISHPFYCPPEANLTFSTFVYRGSVYNDHYYVKVSSDGGANWTVLWDATTLPGGYTLVPLSVQINMAAYGGQQIKIAFHADDPTTNDGLVYDWYIDNIRVSNDVAALSFNPEEMIIQSAQDSRAVQSKAGSGKDDNRAVNAVSGSDSRSLTGYKVWRLREGQEANESVWISLTPNPVSPLTLNEVAWNTLSNGTYRWSVKAIYTNGVASIPVFSNPLVRQVISGTIQGVVRKPNNQPLAGATVSAGGNTTITNSNGLYSLSVPVGTYSVSCSAVGYQTNTVNNINVIANQSVTLNFNMIVSSNEDDLVPVTVTALNGNYPNPFNPETTISYAIKDAGEVHLEIYNLKGQRVRNLVSGKQNTGYYHVVFNGLDDKGQPLSSGIYLYRLTTGSFTSTRKMMLME
jgi:hypothetical protein